MIIKKNCFEKKQEDSRNKAISYLETLAAII